MFRLREINPLYEKYVHLSLVFSGVASCFRDCFAATSSSASWTTRWNCSAGPASWAELPLPLPESWHRERIEPVGPVTIRRVNFGMQHRSAHI